MRARVRGTEIYFDIDGAGLVPDGGQMVERPVLFLVHGGPGGDHSGFRGTISQLRDVAQLVYIDHRGCGRSATGSQSTYTMENNIDDLDALREHLGVERISMLGSSYGGMVAQGYALRYPNRLANLILSVTAPSFRFADDAKRILQERGTPEQRAISECLWKGHFESMDQLKEYYRLLMPMYSTTYKPETFEDSWTRGLRSVEAFNEGFSTFMKTFDYTDRLHEIKCPTLVIGAAHDWICAPNHSRLIADRIPRSHLKIFQKSSHMVAADEPEAYLQAVRGFLTYAPV